MGNNCTSKTREIEVDERGHIMKSTSGASSSQQTHKNYTTQQPNSNTDGVGEPIGNYQENADN